MRSNKLLIVGFAMVASSSWGQFWRTSDPVKLGGTINSEAEESMPVFSKDSSMLYFVRTFDSANSGDANDQDIWVSTKDANGGYVDAKPVKELNNKFNNAVLSINPKGDRMYVLNAYEGKKDMEKGIAMSEYKNGSWSAPVKLEIPGLDIDGDFYGFHVNGSEDVIIISYKGPGSVGEEDLYVTTKTGGVWSAPMHMGSTINSTGFEISPFLSKNSDTLFFSSNGFGGEGDADVFYSVKQGSWTSWSKPINLGNKINSPMFDAYFVHSGSQAYWSSNREGSLADIYMVDILTPPALEVTCSAKDATAFGGQDGSIRLELKGGVEPYTYAWSNGSSARDLMAGAGTYSVTVTDAIGQTAESSCTIGEPVLAFENLELKHNFGYNKNKLDNSNEELKSFLDKIATQLNDGREAITIEVYSSASYVPTKTFKTNEKLAEVRAENIKKEIEQYFKKDPNAAKITVTIVEKTVQGPAYEEDSANMDKYIPYQYIKLKTK